MSFPGKLRKGQFFIVGAILIIIILHMLSGTLIKSKEVEFSTVQDNDAIWTFEQTEKALYEIAKKNLTSRDNIDEFIEMQKSLATENGYVIEFNMDFKPYTGNPFEVNLYTLSLESNELYIGKSDKLLIYYSDCLDVDTSTMCDAMDIVVPGYKKACCKAHSLCC